MLSLRLMAVLSMASLAFLLSLPSEAKSLPPGQRYVISGSSYYRVYSPSYTSGSSGSGAAYYEPTTSPVETRSERGTPAIRETNSTNRASLTRPTASLSEQTGNDNFSTSGQ